MSIALSEADAFQRRLSLLVRAGELFHRSLDVNETLTNVAEAVVESFSDLCLFDLIDERTNRLVVSVGAHRDPSLSAALGDSVSHILQSETRRIHPARHVAETGESFFVGHFDEATLIEHASSAEHEAFMREMRYGSKIVVPVETPGAIFGALTFVRTSGTAPFEDTDLRAAQELGRRAGLAVANAKQFAREGATQQRLALLVRAGELFHRSLDLEDTLTNVARTAVETFADLCLFDLIDDNTERLYVSVGAHRDPQVEVSLKALVTPLLQRESRGIHPARLVAQTGTSFFVPEFDEAKLLEHASSDEHEAFMRKMAYRSKMVVAVAAHEEVFGALTFVRTTGSTPFDRADLDAAQELGRRAGFAVANAKKYSREQHVAETLQRAFLNEELPHQPGVTFSAVYQAAKDESTLGGDWYDAFIVRDSIVVTIGDVMGKGVDAARLMVQLRQWIRMAAVVTQDPGQLLGLLNEALFAGTVGTISIATAFIAIMDRAGHELRFASAGHPPPIVKPQHGEAFALPVSACLPLGVMPDAAYTTGSRTLEDVALLALYTDGLTEIARDALAGEGALRDLLTGDAVLCATNPARFIMRLTANEPRSDDVAVLAVQFGNTTRTWGFDVVDPSSAYAIKRDYVDAVRPYCSSALDLNACEVIFAELIGNAVRYAPGRLSVALSSDETGLTLHVMDEGPGFDGYPSLPKDIWSESGRGLYIVQALAKAFSATRLPVCGTHVQVLLPTNPRSQ